MTGSAAGMAGYKSTSGYIYFLFSLFLSSVFEIFLDELLEPLEINQIYTHYLLHHLRYLKLYIVAVVSIQAVLRDLRPLIPGNISRPSGPTWAPRAFSCFDYRLSLTLETMSPRSNPPEAAVGR